MGKDASELLNRATFDEFAQLFDSDELREVVENWQADSEAALEAIGAALRRDDLAEVGQLAHRAAGGGLALGATRLALHCERLRECAESGSAGVADADVALLRETFATTYQAMAQAAGL